jgi:two-component system nitrogen regulation response regulator GlnG
MSDDRTMTVPAMRPRAPSTRYVEVLSPGRPAAFKAREGVVRIGRDAGNEVVIDDPFLSRIHLEVRIFPHGVAVVDLDTKNGTHFQGARIRELPVKDEVTLLLGKQCSVRIRVGDDGGAAARGRDDGELVGESPAMQRLRGGLAKLAPSHLTVLIEGETGTGKEVVARTIHRLSPRSAKPLVVFDCAAVSPSLIASELFGHVKGAFTGAVGASEGSFRAAHGGTLFLDEIGELPLELQPALLRALEARQVKPVGSEHYVPVDVRVVAATNRSLEDEVSAGRFRKDLLFRLAVGRVKVPALRQRPEDIPALAAHFARGLGATLAPSFVAALAARPWSGNVRELRNAVERSVMLAGGAGAVVTGLDDLDDELDDDLDPRETLAPPPEGSSDALLGAMRSAEGQRLLAMSFQDAKQAAVETFEREYLVRLFEASGCNLSEAARRSGVHRRYLRELFKKHHIDTAALRARKP